MGPEAYDISGDLLCSMWLIMSIKLLCKVQSACVAY